MDLWDGTVIALSVTGIGWLGRHWIMQRLKRRPAVLEGAQQIWTEREFSMDKPVRLVARVDAAWRLATGEVVLVEVKYRRRDRVHRSDVLQLSAQRLAVARASGEPVADWGYVMIDRGRPWSMPRWRRVALMDDGEVIEVVRRREAILAGLAAPSMAGDWRVCRSCTCVHRCSRRWGKRRFPKVGSRGSSSQGENVYRGM